MTAPLTHADSIVILASSTEVYATISDVARTGEWSPVCQECWWDEGDGPKLGAHFTGRNVTPERTWETRCEVVVAEPGRAFGWSVTEGNVHWIYTLEPLAGTGSPASTRLTESWEFTPKGQQYFAEKFGDHAGAEIEQRRLAAVAGIPATLSAMKRVIEHSR